MRESAGHLTQSCVFIKSLQALGRNRLGEYMGSRLVLKLAVPQKLFKDLG